VFTPLIFSPPKKCAPPTGSVIINPEKISQKETQTPKNLEHVGNFPNPGNKIYKSPKRMLKNNAKIPCRVSKNRRRKNT